MTYYYFSQEDSKMPGIFIPCLEVERSTATHFGGYQCKTPDTRPLSVLKTLDQVHGLKVNQGGMSKMTIKGSLLFEKATEL